jgi:hypothetical protein
VVVVLRSSITFIDIEGAEAVAVAVKEKEVHMATTTEAKRTTTTKSAVPVPTTPRWIDQAGNTLFLDAMTTIRINVLFAVCC